MKNTVNIKINIFLAILLVAVIPNVSKASFVGVSPTTTATTSCSSGLSCGLVGYWTFDGKDISNGVIQDKSGNGYNGNAVNIASSTFYASGKIGQAGNFDGVDDKVHIGDNLDLIGSPLTISAWVYPTSYSGASSNVPAIVDKLASGGNYRLNLTGGLAQFVIRAADGSVESVTSTGNAVPLNKWTHVLVVYDNSTTGTIYINGVSNTTKSNFTLTRGDTAQVLRLGYTDNNSNSFFSGKIDDVRIYNRVLSAREILQLYNIGANTKQAITSPITATTSCSSGISCGLAGYWTFDGKDTINGNIQDISGNRNNGSVKNISTSTFYTGGKIGQSFNYDGVDDFMTVPQGTGTNLNLSTFTGITIAGWVRTNHIIGDGSTFRQGFVGTGAPFSNNGTGFNMTYNYPTTGLWGLTINNGVGFGLSLNYAGSLMTGKWTHVTFVLTSTTATLYLNGVATGSVADISTKGISTLGNSNLIIGNYSNTTSQPWDGNIDDVRIYNRALSASEISQLYNNSTLSKQAVSITASSSSVCTVGLACGLIGYWTFDGKDISNGVLLDKSGNNNRGNFINIASTTFYAPGKIGQGVGFDGVDDYVNLSSSINIGNTDWTVSVWAKLSGNNAQHILTNQSSGPVVNALGVYTKKMLYYHYNGSWITETGNAIVANNIWHQLTWVNHSNQTMEMYVDGVLDASGISSSVISTGPVNRIGSGYGGPPNSNFVSGYIDDLRVYNRALSIGEIRKLYNQGR